MRADLLLSPCWIRGDVLGVFVFLLLLTSRDIFCELTVCCRDIVTFGDKLQGSTNSDRILSFNIEM